MKIIISFIALMAMSSVSHSALVGRDLDGNLATFEAYYDTDQDITWLADANYAQSSGYDADGLMTWSTANVWADSLTLGGYTNWRLPKTVDVGNDGPTGTSIYKGVDYGYNITTHSEMSYMFYEILGNTARYDTSGTATGCNSFCLINAVPFLFSNSKYQLKNYWSVTEFVPMTSGAWFFSFIDGAQVAGDKTRSLFAWAVHSGDVGATSVVPVPAAAWLFGSALLGMIGLKRKR